MNELIVAPAFRISTIAEASCGIDHLRGAQDGFPPDGILASLDSPPRQQVDLAPEQGRELVLHANVVDEAPSRSSLERHQQV
jgi:hypothetical protein